MNAQHALLNMKDQSPLSPEEAGDDAPTLENIATLSEALFEKTRQLNERLRRINLQIQALAPSDDPHFNSEEE